MCIYNNVNVLKFQNLFSFCSKNKMSAVRDGIHKMLFEIANREDPVLIWVCTVHLGLLDGN